MNPYRRKLIISQLSISKCLLKIVKSKIKRWWVHPLWRNRRLEGDYRTLVMALFRMDPVFFKKYLRLTPQEFIHIKNLIAPFLFKKPQGRRALSTGHRLAITLRYLATGDSLASLSFAFRIGFTTCASIVKETCIALWKALQPLYLKELKCEDWVKVSEEYYSNWQFPNCLGAVDGKHVIIQAPPNSGSLFFNYKKSFSIVLMAIVDANYKFIAVDVGGYGSISDGGTFRNSQLGKKISENKMYFPEAKDLPNSHLKVPYVLVGDEAFQLKSNFMRPFPGKELTNKKRIFNYRLSRARRCVENAFGIMASRFRIFRRPIILHPNTIDYVIKACIVLHNYLRTESMSNQSSFYCPREFADTVDESGQMQDGKWRIENLSQDALVSIGSYSRNPKADAKSIREIYVDYFNSKEGEVFWQYAIKGLLNQ